MGGDGAAWDVVLDQREAVGAAFDAAVPGADQVDPLAGLETSILRSSRWTSTTR